MIPLPSLQRYLLCSAMVLTTAGAVVVASSPVDASTPSAQPDRAIAQATKTTPKPRSTSGTNKTSSKKGNSTGPRLFEPPPGQSAPKFTIGAGRRTTEKVCPEPISLLHPPAKIAQSTTEQVATILTPINNGGLTISARPTFLMYLPYTSAKALEFSLEDPDQPGEKVIYQMRMPIIKQPGIVRISLPETAPSLETGKSYRWLVTLACKSNVSDPNDPLIAGWITRTQASNGLTSQAGSPITLETIKQYGAEGLWFDAAAGLAALKHAKPQDPMIQELWTQMLEDVDLADLSKFSVKN